MSDPRRSTSSHGLGVAVARWAVVRVRSASMEPTLRDGDLLLVRTREPAVPGALVVVRLPGRPGLAVKRAVRRDEDGWWVERDNAREGVDSWVVGAVPETDIVAKVVRRLWPLRRIGQAPVL